VIQPIREDGDFENKKLLGAGEDQSRWFERTSNQTDGLKADEDLRKLERKDREKKKHPILNLAQLMLFLTAKSTR